MARWRRFDRMVWGLGVSAMGFVALIVVFILGVFLLPKPMCGTGHMSADKVRTDLSKLDVALEAYARANQGRFPSSLLELVVPDAKGHAFFDGTRIPKDPWGNDYLYDPAGSPDRRVRIYSLGRDGEPGGVGADADVDNLSMREER